jgi:hypothetical protein
MTAEQIAKSMAAKFLENGNYEALGAALSDQSVAEFATAAATTEIERTFYDEDSFSGLSVQSVGYTPGAEQEEVVVYVTKGSQRFLNKLPKTVADVPVVVRVMGKVKVTLQPAMAASNSSYFFERNGRIACGGSVAPSREDYAGTLGAFATGPGGTFALSNNHVFAACNHTPVDMPILAPATMDARPNRSAPREVCRFCDMFELRSGIPALVNPISLDAAVGKVEDVSRISSWQGDDTDGYDTPKDVVAPTSGLRVKKFGRTTGLTKGTIEAFVPTPWVLPYKSRRFTSEVWFTDTWTVRGDAGEPFAMPGDSGSLIVTEDGSQAVGLVFAVNNRSQYAIFCPIADVLAQFGGLSLLSGHGT